MNLRLLIVALFAVLQSAAAACQAVHNAPGGGVIENAEAYRVPDIASAAEIANRLMQSCDLANLQHPKRSCTLVLSPGVPSNPDFKSSAIELRLRQMAAKPSGGKQPSAGGSGGAPHAIVAKPAAAASTSVGASVTRPAATATRFPDSVPAW